MIPILCKHEDDGKQDRQKETTFIDLIRSNKKGLRHWRFCSFQCFRIWPDCLNLKHWPILSSASGALLTFTVKSILNYTRVLRSSTKKKEEANNKTQMRRCCMRHLIRTYTAWELIYQIWDQQTVLIKTKRRGRKQVRSSGAFFYHSQLKWPFIFWTRQLHLMFCSLSVHMCHTNGLIIRLPLLMIHVYRLFTAQRTVYKCWFFWQCLDNGVINLCCGRLPLFICLSNIHVKWSFRASQLP